MIRQVAYLPSKHVCIRTLRKEAVRIPVVVLGLLIETAIIEVDDPNSMMGVAQMLMI